MFHRFAQRSAHVVGSAWAFVAAVAVVVTWAVLGPALHFSEAWQLWINTGTTIVTFLMVFLIQNAQNRDGRAVELKLDELIRAVSAAHNDLIDIEDATDEALDESKRRVLRSRGASTG